MEFNKYKLKDLTVNGKGEYGIGAPAVKYSPNLYKYLRITDIDDNGFINTNQMKSINDKMKKSIFLRRMILYLLGQEIVQEKVIFIIVTMDR